MGNCASICGSKTNLVNNKVVISNMDQNNHNQKYDMNGNNNKNYNNNKSNSKKIKSENSMKNLNISQMENFTYKKNKLVASTVGSHERKELPVIKLDNNMEYKGFWKNGMRDGKGEQIWPDQSKYKGDWVEDKAQGFGKLIFADGDFYNGEWKNDKANGHGEFHEINSSIYVGLFIYKNFYC